jgi:hypothetical protein
MIGVRLAAVREVPARCATSGTVSSAATARVGNLDQHLMRPQRWK